MNASALSLPSTAVQWEVISALMGKAVVGSGGRGFILEALAFVVNRGLGLLGRCGVRIYYFPNTGGLFCFFLGGESG